MRRLVKVLSRRGGVHATGQWRRAAAGVILCEECHLIMNSHWPKPCNVELHEPPGHRVCGLVWWTKVSIFHKDFLAQLRHHLDSFILGECCDDKGRKYEKYLTCYTRRRIVVRGNKDSTYRVCSKCGSIVPDGWHGRQYTLSQYLGTDLVHMDAYSNLFIDEKLIEQIDFGPWPDVELQPIGVCHRPRDGQRLPIDLPNTPRHRGRDDHLSTCTVAQPVVGQAAVDDNILEIRKAVLGLYLRQADNGQEYAELLLRIGDDKEGGWELLILEMPMLNVRAMEDLKEARIHFEPEVGVCKDDTVGSEPDELIESSRWGLGNAEGEFAESNYWSFDGLLVDFEHLRDARFRIHVEAQLTNWEDPERSTTGSADFEVDVTVCPPSNDLST